MQFINPIFFIAFTAILIPIAIHLFTFRRYKKIYFSNVSFLKELQEEKQKHSKLKHLIILLMRILAICALVMAFAQPFIPFNKNNSAGKGDDLVSIYIDNSFSMQNTASSGSLLDEAKQKSREILAAYKQDARFQLLTNDFEGRHALFVSKDDFLQFLEELDYSSTSTTLSKVVHHQQDLFNTQKTGKKIAYLISDFQKSISDLSNLPADTNCRYFLVPLQVTHIDNLYIDSVWFNTPVFRPGATIEANVRITNTSETLLEKIPIKVEINKVQRATAGLDIGAKNSEVVKVPFKIDEKGGILQGKVSITDHPIIFDDDFYFSLQVQNRIPILCINNRNENPYINYLFGKDSSFIYKNTSSQNIDFDSFPNYYFIILNELDNIPSGMAQSLAKYVENGGSLLIFPSANIQKDSYKTALEQLQLPYFEKLDTALTKVNLLNEKNALYYGVFESIPENIELPTVFKHYSLQSTRPVSKESLMKLQNGDEFLLASNLGRGKIYLSTSPAQTDFSSFPKHVLFVPTLFNMAFYSQPVNSVYYTLGNTSPIDIPSVTAKSDDVFKIKNTEDDFEMIPELRRNNSRITLQTHNQIKAAGNYLLFSGSADTVCGLSFNYNRLESDMQTYKTPDIEKQLKDAGLGNYEVLINAEKPLTEYLKQQNQGTPLFKYFILLALLFILSEIILLRF